MSYSGYRGRCVGRLLHFLSHYCPSRYDRLIFGSAPAVITDGHGGPVFATYTWDGDTDVPTFVFVNPVFNNQQDRIKSTVLKTEALRIMFDAKLKEG